MHRELTMSRWHVSWQQSINQPNQNVTSILCYPQAYQALGTLDGMFGKPISGGRNRRK
jgi:hypothetical protein